MSAIKPAEDSDGEPPPLAGQRPGPGPYPARGVIDPEAAGSRAGGPMDTMAADTAHGHPVHLARALRLTELVGLRVIIDQTGWLRGDIEIAYQRDRDRSLFPIRVHIASDARDEDLLADGGPVTACQRYNAAIVNLGQLARDLAAMGHAGQLAPGAPLAKVRRELDRLQAMVAARQLARMGYGIARLQTLVSETAYLDARHAQLAAMVEAAGASAAWEGDTEDVPLDHSPTGPREDR
jgi:hypothetical protein